MPFCLPKIYFTLSHIYWQHNLPGILPFFELSIPRVQLYSSVSDQSQSVSRRITYPIQQTELTRVIFWDITLCRPLKVDKRLRGTCRLYLQGRKISQARNQHEAKCRSTLLQKGTTRVLASPPIFPLRRKFWDNSKREYRSLRPVVVSNKKTEFTKPRILTKRIAVSSAEY
jgi:hypothetical protein